MTPEQLKFVGFFAGVGAVIAIGIVAGQWWVRRKIERWVRAEGFLLVSFKGAPFWRGPRAWRRTENQEDYWVVVEDATGLRRTGWLLCTSPWHGFGRQTVDIQWDNDTD